jgi:hypothetical protein
LYKCILRESWENIYVSNIYAWKSGVTLLFLLLTSRSATPEGQADGQME